MLMYTYAVGNCRFYGTIFEQMWIWNLEKNIFNKSFCEL